MLKRLRICNFKGWEDTGDIIMSPITLFFGANSSGKSSIGQFLMILKQTIESPDRKSVFNFGTKNTAVQLGSYQEIVFHRKIDNKISFSYTWSLPKKMDIENPLEKNAVFLGDVLSFEAKVISSSDEGNNPKVQMFEYTLNNADQKILVIGMNAKEDGNYETKSEQYTLTRNLGRGWFPKSVVRFYGFPDEVVAYYQNSDFVQRLNLEQENLFKTISYLGPMRSKADRSYSWTGNEPESVGYSGENTVSAILAARKRHLSIRKPKKKNAGRAEPFEAIIAQKLKDMGLIEEFQVQRVSDKEQIYKVKVKTKGSTDMVDLPDVGFGISQVLPVLVQCFYAPAGSIIIIEQPEIHLHPSAQSILADVMIDVINSKENGQDRNIQLIIETHSEHFLRRLQRRIAEDMIEKNKVSAYFADITQSPARLNPLEIDMFGTITNWPKDFFGDEMGDIIAQSEAALKKRAKK